MNRRSFLQYLSAVAAWFGFGGKPVAETNIPVVPTTPSPNIVHTPSADCFVARVTGIKDGKAWFVEQVLELPPPGFHPPLRQGEANSLYGPPYVLRPEDKVVVQRVTKDLPDGTKVTEYWL